MDRQTKIRVAKFAAVLSAPVVLWAYASGPDAHRTGVPGTNEKNCSDVGCHIGTAVNGGGGNVKLTASGGRNYIPGEKQTITVTITDSTARAYGFQVTARLASDHTKQAGTFTPGAGQFVLCASTNVNDLGLDRPNTGRCRDTQPLEFIEHTVPKNTGVFSFDWTPPSTPSGAIDFYVSANAANGNGEESGDHIYTGSLTLRTTCTGGPKPVIAAGGVINASGFGGKAGVAPGTWLEIYGRDLACNSRSWGGDEFNGSNAPTSLDGTSVTIAGKPAYVAFIHPGQVNVQAPEGIGTGPVPVVVTTSGGASDPVTVTASASLPGLLAPAGFKTGSTQYVGAQLADGSFAGDPAKIPGTTRAARPGEIITLYGIGFGPVTPAIPAGVVVSQANAVNDNLVVRIGQIQATTIPYKGLAPSLIGLYQFNVTVPANVPDGDQVLDVTIGGLSTGQTLTLPVKR